jgi:hypothetical protein
MFNWLLLLIAYLPFQIALNPLPGIDLASGRVFILLLFGIWLIKKCCKWSSLCISNLQTICLLIFLLISGFSVLVAENYMWGLRKFLFFLSVFPLYFLATTLVNDWRKNQKVIWVLVMSSGLVALIGLGQFLAQFIFGLEKVGQFWAINIVPIFSGFNFGALILAYPSWLVNVSGQTVMRAFSLFSDPHMLSFYLGLILPLFVVLLNNCITRARPVLSGNVNFSQREKFTRGLRSLSVGFADRTMPTHSASVPEGAGRAFKIKVFSIIYCLLFITLLLTFSRGAYLAIIVTFLVLARLLWRYAHQKKIALLLCLSLLIFIIPGTPIAARFYSTFNLAEGSNVGRLEMWQQAGQLGLEHLWWGLGLGNYSLAVDPSFGYRNPMTAHNLYLDLFSEIGILAVVVWLILILGTIGQLFRKLKNNPSSLFSLGLIGSLVYFLVHSFFETAIYNPVILAVLMVILGLCSTKSSIGASV